MVKLREVAETATFAWSYDSMPLIATGTLAGAMDETFSSESALQIWDVFSKDVPLAKFSLDNKFTSLAWSKPSEKYERGLLAGAFENGSIQLWNSGSLLDNSDLAASSVAEYQKHTESTLQVKFNPLQGHILGSSGTKGEIFIWDTNKGSSVSPGQAMSPMDKISSFSWNNSQSHIFASAGNTSYTSIWELKAKREVLQLSYSGSNLSVVEWHPTESTKLVTASDSDGAPVILTWDLRKHTTPELVLKGHRKGVLSLDWCKQDPSLLLSSGKDDSTILWNPLTGQKLCEYPSLPNWVHETKFAPQLPEVFASASLDKKILVQSLQDTSPPVSAKVNSANEDDFWNQLSSTDTQQPVFEVKQAPTWLQRPVSATFGFGGKVVITKNEQKGSYIKISEFKASKAVEEAAEKLDSAIQNSDFKQLCEARAEAAEKYTGSNDWIALRDLIDNGKLSLIRKLVPEEKNDEDKRTADETSVDDEDFFASLGKEKNIVADFVPSGEFTLANDGSFEGQTAEKLLAGKNEEALEQCIEDDHILEALVIALNGSESMKKKVKNAYFSKYSSKSTLARVLYSVSNGNVGDIVQNADISSWKAIASSVLAHSEGKPEFSDNFVKLGDRLLASKSPDARDNAIACYIAGDALDKVSAFWVSELEDLESFFLKLKDDTSTPADARFKALEETIEKVLAYQSTNLATIRSSPESLEGLGYAYREYAEALVNNGHFDLACKILGKIPDTVPGMKLEKERISKSLSKKQNAVKPKAYGGISQASPYAAPQAQGYTPGTPAVPANGTGVSPHTNPASQATPFNPYSAAASRSGSVATPVPSKVPAAAPAGLATNPYAPRTALDSLKLQKSPQPGHPSLASSMTPPPPPKTTIRKDVGGWNDLPSTLSSQPARKTSVPSVPSAYNFHAMQEQNNTPPISRTPSQQFGVPPPPRTLSSTSVTKTTPPPPASNVHQPPRSNKYGPASSAVQSPQLAGKAELSTPSSGRNTPFNPYAPKVNNQAAEPAKIPQASPKIYAGLPAVASPGMSAAMPPPPRNPYAPKQTEVAAPAPGIPSAASNIIPPPVTNIIPPAAGQTVPSAYSHTESVPPPPPSLKAQTPAASPAPPAPPAPKYPPGDRSHIPESAQPIYQVLTSELEKLKTKIPDKFSKHLADSEKRINILFDHLNNEDLLSQQTIQELVSLCEAMAKSDYATAAALQNQIALEHVGECGDWMVGVRRLVTMAEAVNQ
ncbi:hypothetical protein KL928_004044 [Ogataea angusta]|uniref:Protein transport protein SEC31 n=1 Tax=Pichia angusta TaxID=870730 RepID=A0AAN6DCT1_PICAN|nr:uncharacterized protein KL928_004044 [Ogataea angusta]KAG7817309.1 hypothetical protein KL928_004044 [Ogataea angusta]